MSRKIDMAMPKKANKNLSKAKAKKSGGFFSNLIGSFGSFGGNMKKSKPKR